MVDSVGDARVAPLLARVPDRVYQLRRATDVAGHPPRPVGLLAVVEDGTQVWPADAEERVRHLVGTRHVTVELRKSKQWCVCVCVVGWQSTDRARGKQYTPQLFLHEVPDTYVEVGELGIL